MWRKRFLAWVKENNPREFITDRYDPEKQPGGDPGISISPLPK